MENTLLLVDEKVKNNIREYMPTSKYFEKLATHFYVFSDPTRLKIISCLSMSKMCVNDIASLTGLNQTTVSHQLKILKAQKIVSAERDGKLILYSASNAIVNDTMLVGVDFLQDEIC